MRLVVAPEYEEAVGAVRADLTEAAKVTGSFEVATTAEAGAAPVVTAVELGQAPARKKA